MTEHIFTNYSDAADALRIKDLKQSLYDDGEVIMDQVLVCLHGEEHKKRRKLENKIFTRDIFKYYENEVFPKTINETLEPYKKSGRMDLVDYGFRVLLNLTADFSGVDRPKKSKEETEKLLTLLKIFASGATLHHSTRDHEEVKDEVRNALKEFDDQFLKHSIERRKNLIKRCIVNIITNGLAYGDKISIQTKKSINSAVIIIEDNGPGIPQGEYLNVFKPFYRIDKSRGLNKSGVGLGLPISQDIIKSHGGNISLSKSKLGGLQVKITLPL